MSTNNWRDEIGPLLLTIQIIVAALTAGCLIFMAIALFLVQTGRGPAAGGGGEMPLLTYMAVAWAGMAIVVRMVVPKMIESAGWYDGSTAAAKLGWWNSTITKTTRMKTSTSPKIIPIWSTS